MVNVELETRMHRNIVEGTNKWSDVRMGDIEVTDDPCLSNDNMPANATNYMDKTSESANLRLFTGFRGI
jgi:hypothetical protein